MDWLQAFQDLPAYARFAIGLRRFLSEPVPPAAYLAQIESRRLHRSSNFLDMVDRCVFRWPASPYRKLLEWAGCTYRDLEALVDKDGVERALEVLSRNGVFVSVEEFKGKAPIRRGSFVLEVRESSFRNPASSGHLAASSGGSRSKGLRTVYELGNLSDNWSAHLVLRLQAYDLLSSPIGVWYPVMPGAGPVVVLSLAKAGVFPEWFTPLKVGAASSRWRSRWGNRFIVSSGCRIDRRFPAPVFVPLEKPEPIVRWLADRLASAGRCTLMSYVSGAVRVAREARSLGVSLEGACFSVSSEPLTPSKKAEIELCGATALPNYSTMESGTIAGGCLAPVSADDMHLLDDTISLIQHQRELRPHGVSVPAFLLTGLLTSFPKVLFNTETGDYGRIEDRQCGCTIEKLGFSRHVSGVLGFDKLTGAGMTFIGSDLLRVLEEVLPKRFGGSALDYQMLEEEDREGQTRMVLLVDPQLGVLDESEIRKTILDSLSGGCEAHRFMAQIWQEARTLQVRRQRPVPTERGKVLPLHLKSVT